MTKTILAATDGSDHAERAVEVAAAITDIYDAKLIYEDQLKTLERDSVTHGTTGGGFDPALYTDGLKAEREQGITIVITSSELAELRRLCDRVAIVDQGRVAGILVPDAPDVEFGLLMGGGKAS